MVSYSAKLDSRTKQHTQFGASASNGSRDMARTNVAEKKKKEKNEHRQPHIASPTGIANKGRKQKPLHKKYIYREKNNQKQVTKFPSRTKGLARLKEPEGNRELQDLRKPRTPGPPLPSSKVRRGERWRDTVHYRNPRPTEGRAGETRTPEIRRETTAANTKNVETDSKERKWRRPPPIAKSTLTVKVRKSTPRDHQPEVTARPNNQPRGNMEAAMAPLDKDSACYCSP